MYHSRNPLGAVIILIKIQGTPVPSSCSFFLDMQFVSSEQGELALPTDFWDLGLVKELALYSHETLLLAAALELGSCWRLLRQIWSHASSGTCLESAPLKDCVLI